VSTPTPTLDVPMIWISGAADYSRLWLVIAAALAAAGGRRGRRAAGHGLTAVVVASITANLVAKHFFSRRRPIQSSDTAKRPVRMPRSSSFPSGHTSSAFAFAAAVTGDYPKLAIGLYGLATAVGYSRVHLGVHYPSDVMGAGVLGLAAGTALRSLSQPGCP